MLVEHCSTILLNQKTLLPSLWSCGWMEVSILWSSCYRTWYLQDSLCPAGHLKRYKPKKQNEQIPNIIIKKHTQKKKKQKQKRKQKSVFQYIRAMLFHTLFCLIWHFFLVKQPEFFWGKCFQSFKSDYGSLKWGFVHMIRSQKWWLLNEETVLLRKFLSVIVRLWLHRGFWDEKNENARKTRTTSPSIITVLLDPITAWMVKSFELQGPVALP